MTFLKTLIAFNSIEVNGMRSNTTITIGKNHASGWESCSKSNLGFGSMYGTNALIDSVNMVLDDNFANSAVSDINTDE